MPLLNEKTVNNWDEEFFVLGNEFFFYHDNTKILQTDYGSSRVTIIVRDL